MFCTEDVYRHISYSISCQIQMGTGGTLSHCRLVDAYLLISKFLIRFPLRTFLLRITGVGYSF